MQDPRGVGRLASTALILLMACRQALGLTLRYPLEEAQRLRVADGGYLRTGAGFKPAGDGPARKRTSQLDITVPFHAGQPLRIRKGPLSLTHTLVGAQPAKAVVNGGLVRYVEAFHYTDALIIADEMSVEQLFFLKDRRAPSSIEVALDLRGGTLQETADGGLEARPAAGAAAFRLGRPVVIDADGRRRDGAWSVRRPRPGRWVATLSFDPAGLSYPLLIDPGARRS